jgi:hypothetical protein
MLEPSRLRAECATGGSESGFLTIEHVKIQLGLELQGEEPVERGWVDRVVRLEGSARRLRSSKLRTAMDDSSW